MNGVSPLISPSATSSCGAPSAAQRFAPGALAPSGVALKRNCGGAQAEQIAAHAGQLGVCASMISLAPRCSRRPAISSPQLPENKGAASVSAGALAGRQAAALLARRFGQAAGGSPGAAPGGFFPRRGVRRWRRHRRQRWGRAGLRHRRWFWRGVSHRRRGGAGAFWRRQVFPRRRFAQIQAGSFRFGRGRRRFRTMARGWRWRRAGAFHLVYRCACSAAWPAPHARQRCPIGGRRGGCGRAGRAWCGRRSGGGFAAGGLLGAALGGTAAAETGAGALAGRLA